MNNDIGESLRVLRNNKNISQETLAGNLNVSRQAVSNWETGKTQPDADTLIQISSFFQVPIDDIVKNGALGDSQGTNRKGLIITLCATVLFALYFVLGLCDMLNIIGVISSVGLATVISLIMYFAFESSIKSNDFTMIAGYKKSDSRNFPRYIKQLRTMSMCTSANAVILNILYAPVCFIDTSRQMRISLIYFAVCILAVIVTIVVVNYKFKEIK